MTSNRKTVANAIVLATCAGLCACGGGGSGGAPTPTPPPAVTTTVSGIVAAGLVAGATVTVTCGTGTTPIGVSSAPTDSIGAYSISLTQDCIDTPVLLTANPSNNGMTVADEFLGAQDNGGAVPKVAGGAAWALRKYTTLTAGQDNKDIFITPLTDMAVELVDAARTGQNRFLNGSPPIAGQPTYPLSTALVTSANAVIRVMVLGDDPSALAAAPLTPASVNTADAGQVQLAVVLAALSMWANNVATNPASPWHLPAATTPTTCEDPLVCGASASPLAALEAALVGDLGSGGHLVMTNYDPDAQGNPRFLTFNKLTADASATTTTSLLPANALQGIALTIESTTSATGPTTVTPTVASTSAALAASNYTSSTSNLIASSWAYSQNGYVSPGF